MKCECGGRLAVTSTIFAGAARALRLSKSTAADLQAAHPDSIMRRRKCDRCGARMLTIEIEYDDVGGCEVRSPTADARSRVLDLLGPTWSAEYVQGARLIVVNRRLIVRYTVDVRDRWCAAGRWTGPTVPPSASGAFTGADWVARMVEHIKAEALAASGGA